MKILCCDVPLGLSATSHSPEAIQGFIDEGFTHFEIGIHDSLPDAASIDFSRLPANAETRALIARRAGRGQEERLTVLQNERISKLYENRLRPWSVHLPFGEGILDFDAIIEALWPYAGDLPYWSLDFFACRDAEHTGVEALRFLREKTAKYLAKE